MGSQTQEAGAESWIIDDTLLVVFAIVFISLLVALACCLKERCNKIVKVLCKAGDQDFKAAFKFFIEKNMHKKLKWINNKTELKRKGKYVLLCNLENRLPGDIQSVLLDLGITIEEEKADILVVVMRKESGGLVTKFNFIGTEDHPLHHLPLINIFYHKTYPISNDVNDKAAEDIKTFFR